jgi:hypothetical protein
VSLNDPKIRIGEYIAHEKAICRNPPIGLHSFIGDRKKLDRSSIDQNINTLRFEENIRRSHFFVNTKY